MVVDVDVNPVYNHIKFSNVRISDVLFENDWGYLEPRVDLQCEPFFVGAPNKWKCTECFQCFTRKSSCYDHQLCHYILASGANYVCKTEWLRNVAKTAISLANDIAVLPVLSCVFRCVVVVFDASQLLYISVV
eukprot:371449_1